MLLFAFLSLISFSRDDYSKACCQDRIPTLYTSSIECEEFKNSYKENGCCTNSSCLLTKTFIVNAQPDYIDLESLLNIRYWRITVDLTSNSTVKIETLDANQFQVPGIPLLGTTFTFAGNNHKNLFGPLRNAHLNRLCMEFLGGIYFCIKYIEPYEVRLTGPNLPLIVYDKDYIVDNGLFPADVAISVSSILTYGGKFLNEGWVILHEHGGEFFAGSLPNAQNQNRYDEGLFKVILKDGLLTPNFKPFLFQNGKTVKTAIEDPKRKNEWIVIYADANDRVELARVNAVTNVTTTLASTSSDDVPVVCNFAFLRFHNDRLYISLSYAPYFFDPSLNTNDTISPYYGKLFTYNEGESVLTPFYTYPVQTIGTGSKILSAITIYQNKLFWYSFGPDDCFLILDATTGVVLEEFKIITLNDEGKEPFLDTWNGDFKVHMIRNEPYLFFALKSGILFFNVKDYSYKFLDKLVFPIQVAVWNAFYNKKDDLVYIHIGDQIYTADLLTLFDRATYKELPLFHNSI